MYKFVREIFKFSLKVNILIREDVHDKLDIPEFEDIFAYMVFIARGCEVVLDFVYFVG